MHNLYKKQQYLKTIKKIRPFEIFWFLKNHKITKTLKIIFSTPDLVPFPTSLNPDNG